MCALVITFGVSDAIEEAMFVCQHSLNNDNKIDIWSCNIFNTHVLSGVGEHVAELSHHNAR